MQLRPLPIVLALLVTLGAGNFLIATPSFLGYSYDLDYSEGFVIEDVNRFLETGDLYPRPSLENGFESVKYPPVFYLIFSVMGILGGVSFLTGRLIVLLSFLGTVVLVYGVLWNPDRLDAESAIIPLILFAPFLSIYTGLTIRVDILAILFSILGLYLFTTGRRYWSAVAFLLAVFVKQTFVAAFLACFLSLLAQYPWREDVRALWAGNIRPEQLVAKYGPAIRFGGVYTVGGVAGLIALQLWSPYFLFNIVGANVGGFALRWDLLNWMHLTFLPLFLLAGYYVYLHRDRLLGAYLFLSVGIALLQMVRGGAWIYPVMEPFVVAVICVASLYQRTPPVRRAVAGVLVVQALLFLWAPLVSGSVFDVQTGIHQNQEADTALAGAVEGSAGPVFTEHAGYALHNDRAAPPEIWGVYEQYSTGRVSASDVRSFFRQKNYTTILAYKRHRQLPIDTYLEEEYDVVRTVSRKDLLLHTQQWTVYRWTG